MCPRLKALKDRDLYLPHGGEVPEILKPICEANLDFGEVPTHWDPWVHLIASVHNGHTSAVSVMARFGSAARGDPLYEVGVGIGRLLRTIFSADYFVNPAFRRELLRVLNRGEATNALKRLIYTGRVANYQAKSEDEMQAVADPLRLLANIVMAWNTAKMQAIFDRWARRRNGAIPPELIARCAPTRTEGINMRGIFRFPIELYLEQLLPSWTRPKILEVKSGSNYRELLQQNQVRPVVRPFTVRSQSHRPRTLRPRIRRSFRARKSRRPKLKCRVAYPSSMTILMSGFRKNILSLETAKRI